MTCQELERDRDDWKAIAEMNSDIIDRLRAEIEEMSNRIRAGIEEMSKSHV